MSYPKTKDRYVGIEFEFFTQKISYDVKNYVDTYLKDICVLATDGSVYPPDDYGNNTGWELKLCVKASQLDKALVRVKKFFETINAETNETCGLHVHLDMRNFHVGTAYDRLMSKQKEIYKSVPSSRKNNEYCQKVDDETINDISLFLNRDKFKDKNLLNKLEKLLEAHGVKHVKDSPYYLNFIESITDPIEPICDHYDGISAQPYIDSSDKKTIEVRWYEGTTDTDAVYRWYMYLADIAYRGAPSLVSKRYINQRIKKHG